MKEIREYKLNFDETFPTHELIEIYPILVFNEKCFRMPLMPGLFQEELTIRLNKSPIPKTIVKPITILHVADLEEMRDIISNVTVEKKSITIWDLLDRNRISQVKPGAMAYTLRKTGIKLTEPSSEFIKHIFNEDGTEIN